MSSSHFEVTNFGELCKHGRARMHMTRPEMVKKLKFTSKYVSDVESGKRRPSQEYIFKVTCTLGLSSQDVRNAIKADEIDGLPLSENVIRLKR